MDRLSIKSRLSLNSSPLHTAGSIFPTVLEEPNLSFSDDREGNNIEDSFAEVYGNRENGGRGKGPPPQQHKSRRRLPLLTSAFRKHCSRSFDSGISYLLTETPMPTSTTTTTASSTSPPLDDVINENDESDDMEATLEVSPRHQPWSPSKHLQQRVSLEPPSFDGGRNSLLPKKPVSFATAANKKQPNTTLLSRWVTSLQDPIL